MGWPLELRRIVKNYLRGRGRGVVHRPVSRSSGCWCSGNDHCLPRRWLEGVLPGASKLNRATALIDGYVYVRDDGFSHLIFP